MCKTFFIMGLTCVGKDYFIEKACEMYPHLFGAVQVGKELRKRYPPEHFQGLGAAPATRKEAIDIYKEQWQLNKVIGKKYILVSGQPRERMQVEQVMAFASGPVIWMTTSQEIILERLKQRFKDDPSSMKLSLDRIVNDKVQLYDTIFELLTCGHIIKTLDVQYRRIEEVINQIAHFGDF